MNLKKALQRAALFAAPDKEEDGRGLSGIRMVPALWAQEGEPQQVVSVDLSDLPPLPASNIKYQIELAITAAGHHGMTCDEVELQLGIPHQTASARIGELAAAGYILDSGLTRTTTNGKHAVVYVSSAISVDKTWYQPIPKRPAYVMATNGTTGVMILLDPDEDVPNAIINAKAAKSAVTALKKTPFKITQTGPQTLLVRAVTGEEFLIAGSDVAGYPQLPPFPSVLRSVVDFDLVRSVVHAAGEDVDRPELSTIHFTREFVEATDQVRAARVMLGGLVSQGHLIPAELFQKWPRKSKLGVGFAIEHGNVYFHVDEELRFTAVQKDDNYFDLSPFFSDREKGCRVRVNPVHLKQCIKFATQASPRDFVRVTFAPADKQINVIGLGDNEQPLFTDVVSAEYLKYTDPKLNTPVVVKGRSLWAALDALGETTVDLFYTTSERPIRIRAPFFTESIWPLIKAEVPTQENAS